MQTALSGNPMQRVAMDILCPLPETPQNSKYIFVIVCIMLCVCVCVCVCVCGCVQVEGTQFQ